MRRSTLLGTAAAIGAAAWLPLTSVFCAIGFGVLGKLHGWSLALAAWLYWRDHRTVPGVLPVLYIAGAAAFVLAFAPALRVLTLPESTFRPRREGHPVPVVRGTSDNHGHAAWLAMDAAHCLFPGPHPEWGGVVVGEAYRVDLDPGATMPFKAKDPATWGQGGTAPLLIDPCTEGPTHSLLFSGSGGGKTSAAIATLLHWTGPAVVVDPSSEIGPVVRAAREAMGHKVVEIAPGRAGFNVLAGIDTRSPYAVRRVLSTVASICGDELGRARDAIFEDAGRNMVACILADMLWDEKLAPMDKTLATFLQGITTPEAQMKRLLASIVRDTKSGLARLLARTLMGLAEETFSGAYFNATTFVSWLFDDAVAQFVSGGDFNPADLLSDLVTVFVQVPLPMLYASPAVVRVVLDAVTWTTIEADGEYARRILLQVDESKRIGKMNAIDLVLGAGRKYGLTLQMMWLSESEITDTYGRESLDYWFESVSWRAYGALRGRRTAEGVSKEMGEFAVLATSEGTNTGTTGKPMESKSKSKGGNTNTHEIKRALIKPDELLEARSDELFVIAGGKKLRCGRALYFRRPEMVALCAENRFVKEVAS